MNKIISIYKEFILQLHEAVYLSSHVDMMLFLLGVKPCLRTQLKSSQVLKILINWSKKFNLYYKIKHDNFLYIAFSQDLTKYASDLDHSSEAHEKKFGELLGYPSCCCEKIAYIGERNIDDYENWLITQPFEGDFKLINPYAYKYGKAFISHVPCSTTCRASLEQAKIFVNFVLSSKGEPIVEGWAKELEKISSRLNTYI